MRTAFTSLLLSAISLCTFAQKAPGPGKLAKEKFRFELNYGYGREIVKTGSTGSAFLDNYIKDLKNGSNFSVGAGYFFTHRGVGLSIEQFHHKNSTAATVVYDDGTQESGILKDDIKVTFYGVSYLIRYQNRFQTSTFMTSIGLGYIAFDNRAAAFDPIHLSSATAGLNFNLNYEYKVTDHLHVGIKAGLLSGSLSSMTVDGKTYVLSKEEYVILNRFSLSGGLRYTF